MYEGGRHRVLVESNARLTISLHYSKHHLDSRITLIVIVEMTTPMFKTIGPNLPYGNGLKAYIDA